MTGKFDAFDLEHNILIGGDFYSRRAVSPQNSGSYFVASSINYLFPAYSFTPTDPYLYKPNATTSLAVVREEWLGVYVQDQVKLPYNLFFMTARVMITSPVTPIDSTERAISWGTIRRE